MNTQNLTSSLTTETIDGVSYNVVEFEMPSNNAFLYVNRNDVDENGDNVKIFSRIDNTMDYCLDYDGYLPGDTDFTLQYLKGIKIKFASVTAVSLVELAYD
jgi:hypothetical protein